MQVLKSYSRGRRGGSEVEGDASSSGEPGFGSQHSHGSPEPSVTLVTEDRMPSSGPGGNQAYTWCVDTNTGKIPIHVKLE